MPFEQEHVAKYGRSIYRVSIIDPGSRDGEKYDPKQSGLENSYIFSHLDM
jgi:hypothetical protein